MVSGVGGTPPAPPGYAPSDLPGVAAGSIAGIFRGRQVVVGGGNNGFGIFVYNGTPGAGNNPIFAVVAPGTTLDPYGNAVAAVVNIGTLGGAHAGFDSAGNEFLADSTGTTRILIDPTNRVIEFFDSSGTGANAALLTIASAAGTDRQTGDPFPAGFTVGQPTNTQINMATSGSVGLLSFLFNNALLQSSVLQSLVQTGVNGQFGQVLFNGPLRIAQADRVAIQLNSSDSVVSSQGLLQYNAQPGHGSIFPVAWDYTGATVTGLVIGVNPTTGTGPTNPATAESWHSLGNFPSGTTTRGRYRLTAEGELELDINLTGTPAVGTGSFPNTLAAAYTPAVTKRGVIAQGGTLGLISVSTAGVVSMTIGAGGTATADFAGRFALT